MPTGDSLTRRALLARAGAGALSLELLGPIERALAVPAPRGARLTDIEHVVFLVQENRSFDHLFGTLQGVRGFADPDALVTVKGRSVFDQADPDTVDNPSGHVLPWHLDTASTSAQCLPDITHAWSAQHYAWNEGQLDQFMLAHRVGDGNGTQVATGCMGYFRRADLPFHYALADAFTICDAYHCSVFGPTNPNRIMSMSGTIDPTGAMGGPCIDNNQTNGQLHWKSYPEELQQAGISWFVYQESDNDANNMLPFFAAYQDPHSELARRGNTIIPTPKGSPPGPALIAKLRADVLAGALPQVSWILASTNDCEHPNAPPASGARFTGAVMDALGADPEVWARTVLFVTYDENGGFFDHVPPPTPAPGTDGEFLTPASASTPTASDPIVAESALGQLGPIGLGFRVPMLVVSPFSAGGLVCSETFDHTSMLRFLEARFGPPVGNLSGWRRSVTGELTSAFNFAAAPLRSRPTLPDPVALETQAKQSCTRPPAMPPSPQAMATQEPGVRRRPSGPVKATGAPSSHAPADRLGIHLRRRRTRGGVSIAVEVVHREPLRRVSVSLNGRLLRSARTARFSVHIPTRELRRGANRLRVAVVDRGGLRRARTIAIEHGG